MIGIDRLKADWSDWRIGVLVLRETHGIDVWLCLPVFAVCVWWRKWR